MLVIDIIVVALKIEFIYTTMQLLYCICVGSIYKLILLVFLMFFTYISQEDSHR
jgi:hypothetical protein